MNWITDRLPAYGEEVICAFELKEDYGRSRDKDRPVVMARRIKTDANGEHYDYANMAYGDAREQRWVLIGWMPKPVHPGLLTSSSSKVWPTP